ncbi:hypothetical protein F2P45_01515 [Massilia sp. CCM 8733]|uniref:SMI1/KNR4 family protein n=1 Tax=Massilia mucilaginosa TaxID=2609282 RepID=A0ABX0NLM9_9BURK|nr:hypothetical protein [Massilia mucilaginosa]NHZ87715.1 hypothetical protein [Massilia mucilaginosa]
MAGPTGLDNPDSAAVAPFVAELNAYFASPRDPANVGRHDIELHLLDRAGSDQLMSHFQRKRLVRVYGGVVLDDGGSDHHFYLTRGPFAGGILFLSHEGENSRVVFGSLDDFLAAVAIARETGTWLTNNHPKPTPLHRDQAALAGFLHALLDTGEEKNEGLVYSAIRSLAPVDMDLLMRLVKHPDFFFAEAVAGQIAAYPAAALRPLAQLCCEHGMPQVQWAGERALKAIGQLG